MRAPQTGVGAAGLAGVELLKKVVGSLLRRRSGGGKVNPNAKAALKALTYVAICAWTFLLSQHAGQLVLSLVSRVPPL